MLLISALLVSGCAKSLQEQSIINSKSQIADPSIEYCKELGYKIKVQKTELGERGVCEIRKEFKTVDCSTWDFFTGKCEKEFTYCEKQGGKIITKRDNRCGFTPECAFCILSNGTECEEWDYFKGVCP